MQDSKLQALWDESRARIVPVNETKQVVRKEAVKAGVPWYPAQSTEVVSEQVAFDALVAASAAVTQAEAVLEQTKTAETQALASFRNTVDEKIGIIERESAYYQRGLEQKQLEAEAAKPPPKPPELSEVTKGALAEFEQAIDDFIATPKIDLKDWNPAKGAHVGDLQYAIVGAPTYGVGRAVALACLSAQNQDKLYGFTAANRLIEYCFDTTSRALQTYSYKVGGKTITFPSWNMVNGPRNDKEWSLADHFAALALEQFSRNEDRPGNGDRIALCLEILDGSAGFWNQIQYRKDLYGPIDRIIHAGIAFQRRHRVLSKFHPDRAQREISKALADAHARNILGEMALIDTPIGIAITHGCVIVGMGDPRIVGGDKLQQFQPNCYCGHDSELLFALGLDGEEGFGAEFQRAYANTVALLNYGAPFEWHSRDKVNNKGESTSYGSKGVATMWNQIAPPAYGKRPDARWLDARKPKPEPITVTTLTGETRTIESADFGDHWRPWETMAAFGGGWSMAFGTDEYVKSNVDTFMGDDYKKFRGNLRLGASSFVAGLAAREGAQGQIR